jgi:hypothetical protein
MSRGSDLAPSDETVAASSARLRRRAELLHQIREEVRFAAAGQGLSLAEVSRRMGDSRGTAITAARSYSITKLADIGTAMNVTFRLVAIPDSETRNGAGLTASGARPRSDRRFKPPQVLEIRRRAKAGESHRAIARDLGVVPSVVSDIVRRRVYRDVADEE